MREEAARTQAGAERPARGDFLLGLVDGLGQQRARNRFLGRLQRRDDGNPALEQRRQRASELRHRELEQQLSGHREPELEPLPAMRVRGERKEARTANRPKIKAIRIRPDTRFTARPADITKSVNAGNCTPRFP